jgi:LuxR family maltose regulon positive regulatory protein
MIYSWFFMATSNAYKAKPREGWVASLQLVAISMEGRSDVSSFIQAFTSSHVYVAEYLMDEVLVHQPEKLTHFLLKTSVMERWNA